MKKTLKIIGWTLFSVFLIALVLPFIVSEQRSEKDGPNMNITGPQVYSSNPFTNLMDRLRNMFGSKRGIDVSDEDASGTLLSDGKNSKNNHKNKNKKRASLKRNKKDNKFAKGAGKSETSQQNGSSASAQDPLNLPETNDWVIGEQTMPLVSAKGMHETKLTDPVYARQKAAQEAGKLLEPKDEIPAAGSAEKSKSGGIFSPIKNWLGIGEKKADKQASGKANDFIASATRSGVRGARSSSGQNDMGSFDRQSAVNDINNMINSIATMRADAKYPNPTTAKEREARDRMIKEETRKEINRLNKDYLAHLQQKMAETPQEHVDVVEKLILNPWTASDAKVSDENVPIESKRGEMLLNTLSSKYVKAVPWKTIGEIQTEKMIQQIRQEGILKENNQEPKKLAENNDNPPILLIYGTANGENGMLSFMNQSLENSSESVTQAYANQKKEKSSQKQEILQEQENSEKKAEINSVPPWFNNRAEDMQTLYRIRGCDKKKCHWVLNSLTEDKNGPALYPVRTTMALAGRKNEENPGNIKEKIASQYTEAFIEEMESDKSKQYYFEQAKKNYLEMDNMDEAAAEDEARWLTGQLYSDANKSARIKEWTEQSQYNFDSNTFLPITEEELPEVIQDVVERGGNVIAGSQEEEYNVGKVLEDSGILVGTALTSTDENITQYEQDPHGYIRNVRKNTQQRVEYTGQQVSNKLTPIKLKTKFSEQNTSKGKNDISLN